MKFDLEDFKSALTKYSWDVKTIEIRESKRNGNITIIGYDPKLSVTITITFSEGTEPVVEKQNAKP